MTYRVCVTEVMLLCEECFLNVLPLCLLLFDHEAGASRLGGDLLVPLD